MSKLLSFEEWLEDNYKDKIENAKSQHGYLVDDECIRAVFYPMYDKYLSENKDTQDSINEASVFIDDICNKKERKLDELKSFDLNEAAIEKWFANRPSKNKTKENKIQKFINNWFYEVKKEFNNWKVWITLPNEKVNEILEYNKMGYMGNFSRPYYCNTENVKIKTKWEQYCKISPNHTIQGFVDYMNWVKENSGEIEIPLYISPSLDPKNPPNGFSIW